MSVEQDFLPVAIATGANVDTQADFIGSGYQRIGFLTGQALSDQINKVLRQATFITSALAQVVANVLDQAVLDNGNWTAFVTQLSQALQAAAWQLNPVAYSATPVFDGSLGNVFEITLAGNVTSSTLINTVPGVPYVFMIHQPSGGGDTFAFPSQISAGPIDATANSTSVQVFISGAGGFFYPLAPMGG